MNIKYCCRVTDPVPLEETPPESVKSSESLMAHQLAIAFKNFLIKVSKYFYSVFIRVLFVYLVELVVFWGKNTTSETQAHGLSVITCDSFRSTFYHIQLKNSMHLTCDSANCGNVANLVRVYPNKKLLRARSADIVVWLPVRTILFCVSYHLRQYLFTFCLINRYYLKSFFVLVWKSCFLTRILKNFQNLFLLEIH